MHAYAVRRLAPFGGVTQVAGHGEARALSEDGVHWRIQVRATVPEHTWRSAGDRGARCFFEWAHWSASAGLHRVRANPLLDLGAMQAAADALLARLPALVRELPFDLADRYECWACDPEGRPVALLASALEADEAERTPVRDWRAAETGAPARRLEAAVRRHATRRRWFERLDDGAGRDLGNGAILPAERFPETLLREDWDDARTAALARDHLERNAPLLLQLPGLSPATRDRLERAALRRPEAVAALFRLYPEVRDPARIRRARVEARLRRTARDAD